jgi:hypothetical protein
MAFRRLRLVCYEDAEKRIHEDHASGPIPTTLATANRMQPSFKYFRLNIISSA